MGQSMGMLDFFVLEAGEYLERLDALAQAPAGAFPNADEFVRTARAWRGGALMASQQPMARAAQGLEAAGRALKDGRVAWDERVRGEIIRAVDDCKKYLHRIRAPASEDAPRAEEIGAVLERLAGRTSAGARAAGFGLDAGGRAFVAREAAAIASALDRAARGLSANRASREPLDGVAPAMSALRGVAVLNDLPPLPDLLAAVEGALREVLATSGAVGPAVPAVFDAAAKALARAAREVVDAGRPEADSAQAGAFAAALLGAFAGTGQILPIERLFYDDAGPHVVQQGAPPAPLSRVEIVSHGDFFERAADDLARAASPVVRDLRLFRMGAMLRPLAGAGGSPVAAALGRLADAGRAAVDRGAAGADVQAFALAVTDAARALRTVESGDEPAVVTRLEAAVGRLNSLGAPAAAPERAEAPAPRPRTTRVVPELAARSARVAPDESQRIPAAVVAPPPGWRPDTSATAPDEHQRPPAAVVAPPPGWRPDTGATAPDESQRIPAAVVAPPPGWRPDTGATAGDERDLAWGYAAMERLIAQRGLPLGSLEELLSARDELQPIPAAVIAAPAGFRPGTSATAPEEPEEEVVPIEALAPDADIVPIESLLYRGQDALRRALELKAELAALASMPGKETARLYELQGEVFDLVELGLSA